VLDQILIRDLTLSFNVIDNLCKFIVLNMFSFFVAFSFAVFYTFCYHYDFLRVLLLFVSIFKIVLLFLPKPIKFENAFILI